MRRGGSRVYGLRMRRGKERRGKERRGKERRGEERRGGNNPIRVIGQQKANGLMKNGVDERRRYLEDAEGRMR